MVQQNIGLVLVGGGARAAYQAGALRGISDCLGADSGSIPFRSVTGISAGAINAAYLAARAVDFRGGAHAACELWSALKAEQILSTDFFAVGKLAAGWMRDLGLGGAFRGSRSNYLLDTKPLGELLGQQIDFAAIKSHLKAGVLHGLALSTTHYKTGTAVTFFDGHPSIEPWIRSSRLGKRTSLSIQHVMASASIPVLFQPVRLENSFYGDGSIRLRAPLSPAIHLGAEKIVSIGIRYFRPEDLTQELNEDPIMERITTADIAGVLLNAAFMDALDSDIERLERINLTLSLLSENARLQHPQGLRPIPVLSIRPSRDLGRFASDQFHRFPLMLRHLLKGIGASEESGWDLLSYLAFDSSYTSLLLELGYEDALARRDEIRDFLLTPALPSH